MNYSHCFAFDLDKYMRIVNPALRWAQPEKSFSAFAWVNHFQNAKSIDDSYFQVNLRLGYKLFGHWELSLSELNLLDDEHCEMSQPVFLLDEGKIGRKILFKVQGNY